MTKFPVDYSKGASVVSLEIPLSVKLSKKKKFLTPMYSSSGQVLKWKKKKTSKKKASELGNNNLYFYYTIYTIKVKVDKPNVHDISSDLVKAMALSLDLDVNPYPNPNYNFIYEFDAYPSFNFWGWETDYSIYGTSYNKQYFSAIDIYKNMQSLVEHALNVRHKNRVVKGIYLELRVYTGNGFEKKPKSRIYYILGGLVIIGGGLGILWGTSKYLELGLNFF